MPLPPYIFSYVDKVIDFSTRNALIVFPAAGAALLLIIIFICLNAYSKRRNSGKYKPVKTGGRRCAITILSLRFCPPAGFGEAPETGAALAPLQDYLKIAKTAVKKTGGVAESAQDGTVIARWGGGVSTGSPAHDALNAVRAALLARILFLELRAALKKNNGPAPLPLVAGISSGNVAAGMLKKGFRRKYFIGETAILAVKAREASEKFRTDIVLTAKAWRLVKDYCIFEEIEALRAPTGEETTRLFALVNLRAAPGELQPAPKALSETRKMLE